MPFSYSAVKESLSFRLDQTDKRRDSRVSNEILSEYEEILGQRLPPEVVNNIMQTLLNLPTLVQVNPTFFFRLIKVDPDDNKFVDCAICGEAELIVTNDIHFDVLKKIDFPKIIIQTLQEFHRSH